MNVAAKKTRTQDYFNVTLEGADPFTASETTLRSSSSPNRGETWVVEATEKGRDGKRLRVFLIVFSKTLSNGNHKVGEDKQGFATIELVNYENDQNPTSKLAKSGHINFQLDVTNSTFSGDFNVQIEALGVADGTFDTLLTNTTP